MTSIIKTEIREDKKRGVIVARFCKEDGSQPIEVATLAIGSAGNDPQMFEEWKKLLMNHLSRLIEMTGAKVLQHYEVRPHEKN